MNSRALVQVDPVSRCMFLFYWKVSLGRLCDVSLRDAVAGRRSGRPRACLSGGDTWVDRARQGGGSQSDPRALGIGIAAFQISGGLLLFAVSYQMIFGDRPHREAREADKALSEHASDIAVFPLAIPLMAGPGAIATTLLLSNAAGATPRLIIVIVTILLVCLLCMLCFRLSSLIARTLGRTGNAVFSRLLGMLLAAYSVQFVLDGVAAVRTTSS